MTVCYVGERMLMLLAPEPFLRWTRLPVRPVSSAPQWRNIGSRGHRGLERLLQKGRCWREF